MWFEQFDEVSLISVGTFAFLNKDINEIPVLVDGTPKISTQIFDVAKTVRKSVIQPHGIGDDVRWKTISAMSEFLFHTGIVAESWAT